MRMSGGAGGIGCGCMIMVLVLNLTLGAVCFDYSLDTIFEKDIPWYGDAVCGLFLGEITIPCAVICWVLVQCDIEAPFVKPAVAAEPAANR